MTPVDPQFEALLGYLKQSRGFDLTGYKRSSLVRRFRRRMEQVGVGDYSEYLDLLQVHPEEFTALFNTVLINVTSFFRDPDAWQFLQSELLEPLIADKPSGTPIRVWSAGCASGEEAYTLAIILVELLGPEAFRQQVKIYATDVDEEQLTQARAAVYTERALANVPPELREKYFTNTAGRYLFRKDLRRSVIFGRNDLVLDAPISRIDLLVCRNTLMYFNAETQARILGRLHFALAEGGILFLGKAEMLLSHASLFLPVDLKRRVFRKIPRSDQPAGSVFAEAPQRPVPDELVGLDQLRNEAYLASPVAQVVLSADGVVAQINRQAEQVFGLSRRDIGRPFRDLELSYRPLELRKHIEQAQNDRRMLRLTDIDYTRAPGETTYLEVQITPLLDGELNLLGVTLVFHDVTVARRLQDDLEYTNGQLETAYEELQSTNEELETTNEELQSTVEELETTNEELQSTNEELETMNEELRSTNDELQHINEQIRESTAKLDGANAFLEAVMASLRSGVVVVNRDMQVRVWNRRAEDLWGLRREEVVGSHLLNLDIGLPIEPLRPLLREAMAGTGGPAELQLPAVNRRGRRILVRVVCVPLADEQGGPGGAIVVMESDESTALPG